MRTRERHLSLGLDAVRRRPRQRRRPKTKSGDRPVVPHRTRPAHDARHPVHVTLRARGNVAFLRKQAVLKELVRTFRVASRRPEFGVVHFSVQADHVHLVVEARSSEALTKRMTGLTTWAARRINRLTGRSGRVWEGRYHRRDLATPTEVRNALVYVLQNRRKHVLQSEGYDPGGFDPYSSAAWLDGWEEDAADALAGMRARHERLCGAGPPVAAAGQWLTKVGWRRARGGALRCAELPRF